MKICTYNYQLDRRVGVIVAIRRTKSILARRKKIFVPLPKEQQLTERTLVLLERRIAKSSRKNESMLSQSEELAARSTLL